MSNQDIIDMGLPVLVQEKKKCKYCYKSKPILHEDLAEGGYFHKECLEKNIEMEIKEALLKSKISFDDLKQPTRGKY